MAELDHWRLFIALPISESVRLEIGALQNRLRKALPGRAVRWTRSDQFHLTLKFLGEVPVGQVDGLIESVRAASSEFSPLNLQAKELGCFPNDRRPRVIWIGVHDDSTRLQLLQEAIDTATAGFGSAEKEKSFKGHITIGRVEEMNLPQRKTLSGLLAERRQMTIGEWKASEVKLIRSELSESGATHKYVMVIPLSTA